MCMAHLHDSAHEDCEGICVVYNFHQTFCTICIVIMSLSIKWAYYKPMYKMEVPIDVILDNIYILYYISLHL